MNRNLKNNLQHDKYDLVENENNEDSEETRSEDKNENNNEDSEKEEEEVTKEETSSILRQSNRLRTPNPKYQHPTTSNVNTEEVCTEETGALIAMTM